RGYTLSFFDKYYFKLFLLGVFWLFFSPVAYAQEGNIQPPERTSLQLTQAEQAWLNDHPVIRVATDPGWRPIEFQDKNGEFKGIAIDYLRIIEKLLGIRFDIVKGNSWAELIEKSKARELDMFSCITNTPEREKYLLFTEPYLSFPATVFTRNDAPYVGNLQELADEKVAVVNGYAFHELLELNHPEIDLVPVESTGDGLQMLEEGQVAAYVGNLLVSSYHIMERGNIFLKVAGETPYRNNLSFATRSDWPALVGILQKALDSLSPDDKRDIYKHWASLSYEHKFDKKLILEIIAAFIIVFSATLIFIQRRQLKERKKAMMEISRRKAEFEAVFNAMTDALVLTDTERHIVMTNDAFVDIFGYSSDEVRGHSAEMFYADPEAYKKMGETRFSPDAEIDQPAYEMYYRRKDGSVFPGETIGVKVKDTPDTFVGFLGCIRDITERKQTTEELLKYRDKLQDLVDEQTLELKAAHTELLQRERMVTLGQLTATVSHELRNPLGTIQTALFSIENSLERNDSSQVARTLELADRSISRCVTIIEELNSYARVKDLDISEASVDDWLRAVLKEQSIPEEISYELDLFSDVRASFDHEKLRQVVVNLIANAVHALQDKQSNGKHLRVSTHLLDNKYEIRISDNGIGMTSDIKEKMFEPLFSTKGFGVGLGMVIVKNIVDQHHGEINIQSKEGEGTTVTLRLPINFSGERKNQII
ncbi:MAG: transporter substrate-binding domain-containing protein, partial [Desulfuromonadales bacterium]|nr:transporter substrate-binding domain-containing protein [Desulfuromonadales bacterium]